MPVKLKDGSVACAICGKTFNRKGQKHVGGSDMIDASSCESSHNAIFFPITREEISALIQFMYTGDAEIIPESLYLRLKRYNNRSSDDLG